ncbi:MAG: hypothetical protein WKG01_05830 [Kofleriaceae bacterium]
MNARWLVLASALTGCYDPDVGEAFEVPGDGGDGVVPGCNNGDTDPGVMVSFSEDVLPLFTRSPGGCTGCHLGRATAGLEMSSYQAMNRGGTNSGVRMIVATEPCNSILIQKLGRTPPFGSRMPLNGPPYFSPEELQVVRDWIAEGATNN